MTNLQSIIQPHLDYCSPIWSPIQQNVINEIEDVQRNFTRRIEGLRDKDYWERLQYLNLYSQERRRERYSVIFIWKIAVGLTRGYNLQFDNNLRRGRYVRERNIRKNSPTSVKKAREASLSVRGAKLFNMLPQSLRSYNSDKVDGFKRQLDQFLKTVPDQPLIQGRRRGAETNSLIHQIPWAVRQNVLG